MSGVDSVQCSSSEFLTMVAYLSQIYESFKGEIPQIKYPRVVSVNFTCFLVVLCAQLIFQFDI